MANATPAPHDNDGSSNQRVDIMRSRGDLLTKDAGSPDIVFSKVWLAFVPLLASAALLAYFAPHVFMMPGSDYWGVLGHILYDGRFDLSIHNLYILDNEHIIAFPKLVYFVNVLTSAGDNRALTLIATALSLGVGIILAAMFIKTLRRMDLDGDVWLLLMFGIAAAAAAFTPLAAHNYLEGMSGVAWISANLFFIGALYVRCRWRDSWLALAFAVVLAILSSQSYSTGVPALFILGCLVALQRPNRWTGYVVIAAGAALVLAIYMHQHVPVVNGERVFDPVLIGKFLALFLGGGLTVHPELAGVWGLCGLLLFVLLVSRQLWRQYKLSMLQSFWTCVGGYAIAAGIMAAIGRVEAFGLVDAIASRYATLPALFWVALAGFALSAVPVERARLGQGLTLVVAACVGVAAVTLLGGGMLTSGRYEAKTQMRPAAGLSVFLGVHDEQLIHDVITPKPDQLFRLRPQLVAIGHVPFDGHFDACPRVDAPLGPVGNVPHQGPKGFVDSGSSMQKTGYVKLHGWVANSDGSGYGRLFGKARCLAIVDRDGMVRGLGLAGLPRPDVGKLLDHSEAGYGWVAYASVQAPGSSLFAYALDDRSGRWYRLGNSLVVTPGQAPVRRR